jgi:hypothetical protein
VVAEEAVPTVAISELLLLHTPPEMASDKLVTDPTQTSVLPDIAAGNGLIVTATLPAGPQQPLAESALK